MLPDLALQAVRQAPTGTREGCGDLTYVKGVTIMVNSFFTGYRYEDVWLDK